MATRPISANASGLDYRPEIDGLRALAVVFVILVHAFPGRLRNGYIGVDIFFVLSGFLITGILLNELRGGSFSLQNFYVRRVNRIFPALVAVLITCLILGWLSLYADEYKLLGRSIAAGAGFAANINFYAEAGYWDISSALKPLLHLWSLGVEEQFYLLWPVLLWAAWTRRWGVAWVLTVVFSASLAWNLWSVGRDQAGAFYLPLSRFWELLAGAAVAYVGVRLLDRNLKPSLPARSWREYSASGAVLRNISAFLGLTLIAVALVTPYPPEEFPGWRAIVPVLGTVLIIAAGSEAWLNSNVLANRWLVYVGLISYPLYMWHWPLLTFARIHDNGKLSSSARNIALLFTVILAAATYHLVERPIRFRPQNRRFKAALLASLLAGCGILGYVIFALDGVQARYDASTIVKVPQPTEIVSGSNKVAILGDSQAGTFYNGLPIDKSRIVKFARGGWPYLLGAGVEPNPDLFKATDEAIAAISSDPTVELVVIAHMFNMYTDPTYGKLHTYPLVPGETAATAYYSALRRTVNRLTDAGKKVVYIKSIPFLGGVSSVMSCSSAVLPIPRVQPTECLTPVADVRKFRQGYDEAVADALRGLPGVSTFDPLPYLCDNRFCYVQKDGIVMYQNTSHLSLEGSYLIGLELAKQLAAQRAADERAAAH